MNRAAVLSLALLAAGCARDRTGAPSLALRPTELRGFEEPARTAPPGVTAADPALDAQVAEAGTALDQLVKSYDAAAATATRAVAAPGARGVGGEAWLTAQAALATLDDRRAQVTALTADLDARARGRPAGSAYPALDALTVRATAEVARESAAIAALSASLPQP